MDNILQQEYADSHVQCHCICRFIYCTLASLAVPQEYIFMYSKSLGHNKRTLGQIAPGARQLGNGVDLRHMA